MQLGHESVAVRPLHGRGGGCAPLAGWRLRGCQAARWRVSALPGGPQGGHAGRCDMTAAMLEDDDGAKPTENGTTVLHCADSYLNIIYFQLLCGEKVVLLHDVGLEQVIQCGKKHGSSRVRSEELGKRL